MKNMPPADLAFTEKYPDKVDIMIAAVRESFKQGADPNVKDGQMLTSEWGFDLKNIEQKKVLVWHGTMDVNVPVERGRYFAEHIPHAVLKEYEGDTHITIHEHAAEILRDLITVSAGKH
jgi:pimeloyl-ACP methyl ester carboxylesterase